jgi:hypothetical protein
MKASLSEAEGPCSPYSSSPSSFSNVGLCLGDFAVRFFTEGSVRVGGGAPIFSRAAAFTAVDALNGLGLRGFDGMDVLPLQYSES